MNINRAIKELTKIMGKWQFSASNERDAAIALGIEALKREKVNREDPKFVIVGLLPGETKGN